MFHGFNGEFRRRPEVSIRGASKKETREDLVRRTKEERRRREDHRLEIRCAVRIQSVVRRFLSRRRWQTGLRGEFDEWRAVLEKRTGGQDEREGTMALAEAVKRIGFFFSLHTDKERLTWLCSRCVSMCDWLLSESVSSFTWKHRLGRLLAVVVRALGQAASSTEENVNPMLRLLELSTASPREEMAGLGEGAASERTAVSRAIFLRHLFPGGYFASLRTLCDARLPPLLDSESPSPPTPMAGAIFDLVVRPVRLARREEDGDGDFGDALRKGLCAAFLAAPFSEQVRLFVLPALAHSDIPVFDLITLKEAKRFASPSPWMLYSYLKIGNEQTELSPSEALEFLCVLRLLCQKVLFARTDDLADDQDEEGDSDDESEAVAKDEEADDPALDPAERVLRQCRRMLNHLGAVSRLVAAVEHVEEKEQGDAMLLALCSICHNLLLSSRHAVYQYRLLNTLAFSPALLHRLWNLTISAKQETSISRPSPLLTMISKGLRLTPSEQDRVAPLLAVFSALFGYLLVTVHDTEFYGAVEGPASRLLRTNSFVWMPFTLKEMVPMSLVLRDVALGLVALAFPDSRPTVTSSYRLAVRPDSSESSSSELTEHSTRVWSHLFKQTVKLLRQLYSRDTRRQYCPDDHWICPDISLPLDRTNELSFRRSRLAHYRPFHGLRVFTRQELETEGPPLSAKEVRLATILREMPYAVSFSQRVLVFHNLVTRDKNEHQGQGVNFLQGSAINISVRRNYLYEDSSEKLSPENEPNLRLKMRVQLKNTAGLDEAGIDGGGLFREFMTELLRTAFDPNRGFFKLTRDQQLYPNPSVAQIEPKFVPHYYFIGRILGKALYEGHLVELPLASFFLSKLLGQANVNVDLDHLSFLDHELYKNLLYLKTYEGDVSDLGLDFTVMTEEIGQKKVEELKPGGKDIPVDDKNKIEYIHHMADYKLNKQIKAQCNAFRQGMNDVIDLDWLRMFSYRELQTLISGSEQEIDVDDLIEHTNYGNGFTATHPTVVSFWRVFRDMEEADRRALLKFVTSCSRPPLLGFKELDPPFCIQNAGSEPDRLPTASTCMNLLKLPEFKDEKTLREKLYYAIKSGAGFELS